VYELTDYGGELKPVIRELALWGARSLGPPGVEEELFPGWLANAIDTVLGPLAPTGRFEFRIGDEVASIVDGEAVDGPIEDPDVVVEGDPAGIYRMFVDRSLDCVEVKGNRGLLKELIEAAPPPVELPLPA
jgi:hypothetical protein